MSTPQEDPPKLNHIAPKWFLDYFKELYLWLRDHRPVPGDNCTITDAAGGGSQINVALGDAVTVALNLPWSIVTVTPEAAPPYPGINQESVVSKHLVEDVTIDDFDLDLSVAAIGDLIYLEYDFAGATLTLKIGRWTDYPAPFKISGAGTVLDPYVAEKYFKQLHRCVDKTTTDEGVELNSTTSAIQDCDTNLLLEDACQDGLSVFILRPFSRSPTLS